MDKHKKRRDLYNILFTLAFLLYTALGVYLIGLASIEAWIKNLQFWDMFLLVFAIQRTVRLFVYDGITEFFRDLFLDVQINTDGTIVRKKFDSGFKRSASDVLLCPWCFSVWASVTIVFLLLLLPTIGYFITVILALSAVASVLQISSNAIGWSAENGKLDAAKK